ncbi:MAG: hypothetical protein OEY31_04335, partial [Candidatus Bathyarchaeota archaeon]|nr:hypothetical protein [Candidatus Bathyarchaeota archaeon]
GRIALDGKPRDVFTSEEARLIGVGIPKATRLFQILKENGLDLRSSEVPVTSREAAAMLREVMVHD